MSFKEKIEYELWEFGWDGFAKSLKVFVPCLVLYFGWQYWKNSYPERRIKEETSYNAEAIGTITKIEKKYLFIEGYFGNELIFRGYMFDYHFKVNGDYYTSQTFMPKPRTKEMLDFVKLAKKNIRQEHFLINYDSNNPSKNTLVLFGNHTSITYSNETSKNQNHRQSPGSLVSGFYETKSE